MDCQHCEKTFSEISEFEAHTIWHTERQAQLQRRPRKYSTHERPRSASTGKSTSSRSDGSAPNAPESTTTTESPSSVPKNSNPAKLPITFSEHNIPDFDFNFGTILPITPVNTQSLSAIKTLEDVMNRFPAFEVEKTDHPSYAKQDYRCADCEAIFSTQKDCDFHNQSRFCPGSAAVAYALYRDIHQPGGYRIDKKYLPFNGQQTSIKCQKCHLSFSTRLLKIVHEHSHPPAHIACLHCQKPFSTTTELEAHYQWHDDMEYRHHRNKCRRKLPGLKLQTKTFQKRQSKAGVAEFGRKSVFLADDDLTAIPENSAPESREQVNNFEPDKELVAISFISPEDLERIHAPNGFFREAPAGYLNSQVAALFNPVADALDALEGRSSESQGSSIPSTASTDRGDQPADPPKLVLPAEDRNLQANIPKKRPSIRSLFRRTRSEPQLESISKVSGDVLQLPTSTDLNKRSSFRRNLRRDSDTNLTPHHDRRLMFSAILQRVSTAANKGDLKTVRKECDRLMGMKPPVSSEMDPGVIPVQAFAFPEGTMIQDTAGNSRYISSHTLNEITSALRHTPVAGLAKTKVGVLSTRAYLSTQEEEYEDASWCYRQVLDLLREHPMVFPDVIWHAAILSNLAHLSARLGRPGDEEKYYLKALAISYNRYGRKDLNNINFLRALAAAYEKSHQTTKAAEVFKRSLFARMEISGPGQNETLMAMQELAAIYVKLGCLTVAKLLYEQCLSGFEAQIGLSHKVTLLIVDRLCNLYMQLQSHDQALALYARSFPHLEVVCQPDEDLPRNWLSRYIQHTKNFDFPPEVTAFLQSYRTKPSETNLWVLQSLARVYMLAGLLTDACDLFEFVYNTRRRLQGEHDASTLDALHGYCLALECMDSIDTAHAAYTNLIQLSLRSSSSAATPSASSSTTSSSALASFTNMPNDANRDGKVRAMNVRTRLIALQERKKVLAGEKEAWGLKTQGPCGTCKYQTALLCKRCQICRFCCEACQDLATRSHDPTCHSSVTLCQSKSVTALPSVPQRIEKQVIERLSYQKMRKGGKATLFRVANSFTFSYDPRNFTTFRVKFNSAVDTYISFDRDADIRFAIVDPAAPVERFENISTEKSDIKANLTPNLLVPGSKGGEGGSSNPPSSRTSLETERSIHDFKWSTPQDTETLLLNKGRDVYLVVAPGEALFRAMVEWRRAVRRGDSERLESLAVPDETMVGYAQGLVLQGVERRRFCYLVEVQS